MKYVYYPGCSQEVTAKNYDVSAKAIAKTLGLEMEEMKNWNCCGVAFMVAEYEVPGYAVPARNLALAEKMGADQMVTVCPACLIAQQKATNYVNEYPNVNKTVNEALGKANLSYSGKVTTRHLLDVIYNDLGLDKVRQAVKQPLAGLKLAAYSGCQLTRPLGKDLGSLEYPMILDETLQALGAETVDYSRKARCCGGMAMTTAPDTAMKLCWDILEEVSRKGAQAIVTACPLCQINLEGYQGQINSKFNSNFNIPVVYFTQVMGLAFGLPGSELRLNQNMTDARVLETAGKGGK